MLRRTVELTCNKSFIKTSECFLYLGVSERNEVDEHLWTVDAVSEHVRGTGQMGQHDITRRVRVRCRDALRQVRRAQWRPLQVQTGTQQLARRVDRVANVLLRTSITVVSHTTSTV